MASWGRLPLGREGDAHSKSWEGWRMLLCGKGEQYSAHATGSFVLFVYVFIASVPESSQLLSVTMGPTLCAELYFLHISVQHIS